MWRFFIILSWLFLGIIPWSIALAHPGRTDAYGCHACRTNCPNWGLDYGEYHCHNAKALPQPKEPIHSRFGEGGTGYTVPAPEYKNRTDRPEKTPQKKNEIQAEDVIVVGSMIGGLGWLLKKLISVLK